MVGGETFYQWPVTSGVSQRSVLTPTLVLVYINDITQKIDCDISLFADVTFIYRTVDTENDKMKFWREMYEEGFNLENVL